MVVGESEIQGQVRAAADRAAEEGLLGPVLAGVYRQALAAAKRIVICSTDAPHCILLRGDIEPVMASREGAGSSSST